jgi:hypothetical protein
VKVNSFVTGATTGGLPLQPRYLGNHGITVFRKPRYLGNPGIWATPVFGQPRVVCPYNPGIWATTVFGQPRYYGIWATTVLRYLGNPGIWETPVFGQPRYLGNHGGFAPTLFCVRGWGKEGRKLICLASLQPVLV